MEASPPANSLKTGYSPPDDDSGGLPCDPSNDIFAMRLYQTYKSRTPSSSSEMKLALPLPKSYHSLIHYLALYILAIRDADELLQNHIMSMVQKYYRSSNTTASPFCLEYVYTQTQGPCAMRKFLLQTAVERVVNCARQLETGTCEIPINDQLPKGSLSRSMKKVLTRSEDLAIDFIEELIASLGSANL